jgi:hypothetical protein
MRAPKKVVLMTILSIVMLLPLVAFRETHPSSIPYSDKSPRVKAHQVREYFTIKIRKVFVWSDLGATSKIIEETVQDTELNMVYVHPKNKPQYGIIGSSSVFGYSHNVGSATGGITTNGAWLVRWGVNGIVTFNPCKITLYIYEEDLPGLEYSAIPILGIHTFGPTEPDKAEKAWEIKFPPGSGYGWAPVVGPGVVTETNPKIEVFLQMHREPSVKIPYPHSYDTYKELYSPRCDLQQIFDPPPLVLPPEVQPYYKGD